MRIALLLVFAFSSSVRGQQPPLKWSSRVSVVISAPTDIRDSISSHVNRELRKIGDITVTDTTPDFILSAVVIAGENKAIGVKYGYVASVVVLKPKPPSASPLSLIKDKVDGLAYDFVSLYFDGASKMLHHSVMTLPNDLEKTAKEIVASVDTDVFEPDRKSFQDILDRLKKK